MNWLGAHKQSEDEKRRRAITAWWEEQSLRDFIERMKAKRKAPSGHPEDL